MEVQVLSPAPFKTPGQKLKLTLLAFCFSLLETSVGMGRPPLR